MRVAEIEHQKDEKIREAKGIIVLVRRAGCSAERLKSPSSIGMRELAAIGARSSHSVTARRAHESVRILKRIPPHDPGPTKKVSPLTLLTYVICDPATINYQWESIPYV